MAEPGSAAPAARPAGDTLAEIEAILAPLAGRRILDIGCGGGQLLKALGARGAQMTGVDPDAAALEKARATAPSAALRQATAEALPFDAAAFDVVIFLNSLHHVPEAQMQAALVEAGRVAGSGPVIVVEPLAEGSFFKALVPVEDETEVRHAAQAAIAAVTAAGKLRLVLQKEYDRVETYAGLEPFLTRIVQADPARVERLDTARAEVARRLDAHGERSDEGYTLRQPLRLMQLAVPI